MEGAGKEGRLTRRLYYEDFEPGLTFGSGSIHVTDADVHAFARRYDPQPFHLDEQAAAASVFRGLAASGWHTAAMTMRLLVDGEMLPEGGIVGVGMDELRWPTPTRPGDTLTIETEVLPRRDSRTYPDRGFVKWRTTTRNQEGAIVQVMVANLMVPRRERAPPAV